MPIWSEILPELANGQPPDFDGVRRKYLVDLHTHTGWNVILYASGWLQKDLWWARRPLAACRAVLFAQLVDDDPSACPCLLLDARNGRRPR